MVDMLLVLREAFDRPESDRLEFNLPVTAQSVLVNDASSAIDNLSFLHSKLSDEIRLRILFLEAGPFVCVSLRGLFVDLID